MPGRFSLPTLIMAIVLVFSLSCQASADGAFQETIRDMEVLWEAYEDAEAFREKYRAGIWKARIYMENFKSGNYATKLKVILEAGKLITSVQGRQMTRAGIEMYDKYSPHAVRILRKHCPIGPDGRISGNDIRRTCKKVATSYMFYQWQEHPFALTFQPWKLASVYRTAYDKTYESLKLYQDAVEFWYDDNPIAKLMRKLAGSDSGFDVDDYDIHDLIKLLDYDDFDPNDAFDKLANPVEAEPAKEKPSRGIYRDPTPDF